MPLLRWTDQLETGRDYTFRYGIGLVTINDATTLAGWLYAYSFLDNVSVDRSLFGNAVAIQFTWTGPPTQVGEVATTISAILDSHTAQSFTFLDAETARVNEPTFPGGGPGTTRSYAWVGVAVIVVAVAVGLFAVARIVGR